MAEVSAKDTNAALRRHVTPLLRAAGFGDATGRKFWRHGTDRIDHVDILGFSSYRAQTNRVTTASFTVHIAISLPRYGVFDDPYHRDYIKDGPKGPRPSEAQFPIRGVICPPDAPPMVKGRWGWEYCPTFLVRTAEEAEAAAEGLAAMLGDHGLDWLGHDWDMDQILALLDRDETDPIMVRAPNGSHLRLHAGLLGSPVRQAHLAMARAARDASRGHPPSAS